MPSSPSPRELFCQAIALEPESRSEFLDTACKDEDDLRRQIEELLSAHEAAGRFMELTDPGEASGGAAFAGSPSDSQEIGTRVGPYELRERVGVGGMGVVYAAEQREPIRRRVAVKLVRSGLGSRDILARFQAERQALALMNHPGIAKIHDAGMTADERPYFAMEYVEGVQIADYCDRERLTVPRRLELFVDVCEAVQHAHQKGVIHRDLKPANILVDPTGERAQPKIIDFGIAKTEDAQLTAKTIHTQLGALVGTPLYMSPEQAGGTRDIDTRSDIYSLGVILYELLSGGLPHEDETATPDELARAIRENPSPKPSTRFVQSGSARGEIANRRQAAVDSLARALRGDLDWITLKALEKEPERRYASASELAADIRRYLDGEPVLARRPSTWYLARKFVARNRGLSAAVATVVILLVAGASTVIALQQSAGQRLAALAESRRRELYPFEVFLASRYFNDGHLDAAQKLLDKQRPEPDEEDLRGFEWRLLWSLSRGRHEDSFEGGNLHAVAFSPDERWLAYGSGYDGKGHVRVRDLETRELVFETPHPSTSLAFSPDGAFLAGAANNSLDGGLRVWETSSWTEVFHSIDECSSVDFSPDGRWMASVTPGAVVLRHTAGGDWAIESEAPTSRAADWNWRHSFGFSPDSSLLLVPSPGPVLVRVPSLETDHIANLGPDPARCADFKPDGQSILFGFRGGIVKTWSLAEKSVTRQLQAHETNVQDLVVSPEGTRLITVGGDQSVGVWNLETGQSISRLRGHVMAVWAVDVSPDGRTFATASPDRTVKLWRVNEPAHEGRTYPGLFKEIGLRDGRPTVAVQLFAGLSFEDIGSTEKTVWNLEALHLARAQVSPSLDLLAAVPRDHLGRAEIWSTESQTRLSTLETGIEHVRLIEFAADDSRIAVSDRRRASIREIDSGEEIASMELEHTAAAISLSPDGRTFAVAYEIPGNSVAVWDLATGQKIRRFDVSTNLLSCLAYSWDGRRIATAGVDARVKILDLDTGSQTTLLGHLAGIRQVCFSPDDRTLASVDNGGVVKLWSTEAARELLSLKLPGTAAAPGHASVAGIGFSPDGSALVVGEMKANGGKLVRSWSVPSLEDIDSGHVTR